MDWKEALEEVVAATGVTRYRELCESGDPATRDAYRARMVAKAGLMRDGTGTYVPGPPIAPTPPARLYPTADDARELRPKVEKCPARTPYSHQGCGCNAICGAGKGKDGGRVNTADCILCLWEKDRP